MNTNNPTPVRRKCSQCGEGLGFTEGDPCDRCAAQPAGVLKLSRCKFCGRESKIEGFLIDNDPQWWYVATCVICPVKTYDQQTPQEAARIWNACAPQPSTANLLTPEERDLVIGAIPLQALPAFRNTKEAMEYAARHKMPAVAPVATPTDTEERIQRAAQSIWNNLDRTWSVEELIDVIAAEFK